MFYLKTQMPNGGVAKTEITDENVYTRCPDCGRELPVDLVEVFSDGKGALYSTSIICSACTKQRGAKRTHLEGIKITVDGLALLSDTLCRAGYAKKCAISSTSLKSTQFPTLLPGSTSLLPRH
jgi:hypothetical protein